MGKSSKKSATKVEEAPAVIKATKPLKKGKREPEDDLETKVNLKKQKKDVIAAVKIPEKVESSDSSDSSDSEEEKKSSDVEMVDSEQKSNAKQPKTPSTPATGGSTLFTANLSFQIERSDVASFSILMDEIQSKALEEKLKNQLGHLELEHAVFERMVYKNKNQHRRCSYFQYLLKVRRDLRLLRTANMEEILKSCFFVISGKRSKQKIHVLESLKLKRIDTGKPNILERLLGALHLLSQMIEPILKAASGISTLLAQSFFKGFCVTFLALLARLRVLVQQILLDAVSVFNMVTSTSLKK